MNELIDGAPYVGVATGGVADSGAYEAISVEKKITIRTTAGHILATMQPDHIQKLKDYLCSRVARGVMARNKRVKRYAKIDRIISTWQKLSPEDSERELKEDNTGRVAALPMNLPVLASHLNDMTSYFAEALAPISNPFFSASGDPKVQELLKKFNRDAAARDYFGNLCSVIRSLLKYNLGGFRVCWDDGRQYGRSVGEIGNHYERIDLYNTIWDPAIRDPKELASKGEFAGTVTLENRLELMRRALAGEWYGLSQVLDECGERGRRSLLYKTAASEANIGEEGVDSRTSNATGSSEVNWSGYGLGIQADIGPEIDGYEVVDMECWLFPAQFGLLTDDERKALEGQDKDPESLLELWRFVLVGDTIVDAKPVVDRMDLLGGERVELSYNLAYLTEDELKEAQRSFMELMKGFQRFSSAMYNIYIAGMRKNVWGLKVYDPGSIDVSQLKNGDTVGLIPTKERGRDVRTALHDVSTDAGVNEALQSVDSSLTLKDKFFPSQALPSNVAGIDRAIKSQVQTVVQGTTRAMRTILRTLDSGLMLPARMAGYRNLKRLDKTGIEQLTDEDVAKLMGSGIESMESERVSEVLWQLLYAIIQNQESMQVFSIPDILSYLGRVGNLSVDLGQFARQPQQPQQQQGGGVTPPVQQPPTEGQ